MEKSDLIEKIRLIREGAIEEKRIESNTGESLLEAVIDLYLTEADDEDLMLESINLIEKISTALFNKFKGIEKSLNKNDEIYKDLSKYVKKYPKDMEIEYDLTGWNDMIQKTLNITIDNFNKTFVSSGTVFDALTKPSLSKEEFDRHERHIEYFMKRDINLFKELLRTFYAFKHKGRTKHYLKLRSVDKYMRNEEKKEGVRKCLDLIQRLKTKYKEYMNIIDTIDNKDIPSYKSRAKRLVKKAAQNQIYFVTNIIKMSVFLIEEERKAMGQIAKQVGYEIPSKK